MVNICEFLCSLFRGRTSRQAQEISLLEHADESRLIEMATLAQEPPRFSVKVAKEAPPAESNKDVALRNALDDLRRGCAGIEALQDLPRNFHRVLKTLQQAIADLDALAVDPESEVFIDLPWKRPTLEDQASWSQMSGETGGTLLRTQTTLAAGDEDPPEWCFGQLFVGSEGIVFQETGEETCSMHVGLVRWEDVVQMTSSTRRKGAATDIRMQLRYDILGDPPTSALRLHVGEREGTWIKEIWSKCASSNAAEQGPKEETPRRTKKVSFIFAEEDAADATRQSLEKAPAIPSVKQSKRSKVSEAVNFFGGSVKRISKISENEISEDGENQDSEDWMDHWCVVATASEKEGSRGILAGLVEKETDLTSLRCTEVAELRPRESKRASEVLDINTKDFKTTSRGNYGPEVTPSATSDTDANAPTLPQIPASIDSSTPPVDEATPRMGVSVAMPRETKIDIGHTGTFFGKTEQLPEAERPESGPTWSMKLEHCTVESIKAAIFSEDWPIPKYYEEKHGAFDFVGPPWAKARRVPGTWVRRLSFRMPLPDDIPKAVRVLVNLPQTTQVDVLYRLGFKENCVVVVQQGQSHDVPFAEYFRVQDVQVFRTVQGGVLMEKFTDVIWVKSLPWTHKAIKLFIDSKAKKDAGKAGSALAEYLCVTADVRKLTQY